MLSVDLVTSTPLPGKEEKAAVEEAVKEEEEHEEGAVLENQLQLAVEVRMFISCCVVHFSEI